MLLDCDLESLGGSLRAPPRNIVSKGVSSVRSPVDNLARIAPDGITHNSFVNSTINAFRDVYKAEDTEAVQVSAQYLPQTADTPGSSIYEYISNQESELQAWEWLYGQTPEFTESLQKSFAWGHVEAEIRSRHGIISSVKYNAPGENWVQEETAFADKRFGFLPNSEEIDNDGFRGVRRKELYEWIRQETNLQACFTPFDSMN